MKNSAFKDNDFIRGKYATGRPVPLTKFEIRVLTISQLGIEPDDIVLDIGAGTGGLTLEAARYANKGKVVAVEKEHEAVDLLKQNLKKNEIYNVVPVQGTAPEILDEIGIKSYDRIILGGSDGNIIQILEWTRRHLKCSGRICANFITLENCTRALEYFKKHFSDVEILQVQISRGSFAGDLTLMKAENPIYIISASLTED